MIIALNCLITFQGVIMKTILIVLFLFMSLAKSHASGWVSWLHYRSGNVNICEILIAHTSLNECVKHIKESCLRNKKKPKMTNSHCEGGKPYFLFIGKEEHYNYRCLPAGIGPRFQQRTDRACSFSKRN